MTNGDRVPLTTSMLLVVLGDRAPLVFLTLESPTLSSLVIHTSGALSPLVPYITSGALSPLVPYMKRKAFLPM